MQSLCHVKKVEYHRNGCGCRNGCGYGCGCGCGCVLKNGCGCVLRMAVTMAIFLNMAMAVEVFWEGQSKFGQWRCVAESMGAENGCSCLGLAIHEHFLSAPIF
jgi:hypothetical protein